MDNVVYVDCVLINGKVVMVDVYFSFKCVIVVKQGWIINVGEDQEIQQYIGFQMQVIDFGGKFILFVVYDLYIYIGWFVDSWYCLNCQDVCFLVVLWERLCDQVVCIFVGVWICVCGLDLNVIKECVVEQCFLMCWDIDDVMVDYFILFVLWDGYFCIVNSWVLVFFGFDVSIFDFFGGYLG